jgi:hypothetical protein
MKRIFSNRDTKLQNVCWLEGLMLILGCVPSRAAHLHHGPHQTCFMETSFWPHAFNRLFSEPSESSFLAGCNAPKCVRRAILAMLPGPIIEAVNYPGIVGAYAISDSKLRRKYRFIHTRNGSFQQAQQTFCDPVHTKSQKELIAVTSKCMRLAILAALPRPSIE